MNPHKCQYIRTVTGTCHQQNLTGGPFCYYHKKVKSGLINADEKRSLYDSQEA